MPVRIVRGDHAALPMQHRHQRIADTAVVERAAEAGETLRHGGALRGEGSAQGTEPLTQRRVTELEEPGNLAAGLASEGQHGDRAQGRRKALEQRRHFGGPVGGRGRAFGQPAGVPCAPPGVTPRGHACLVAQHTREPGAVGRIGKIEPVVAEGFDQCFLHEVVDVGGTTEAAGSALQLSQIAGT